MTNLVEATLYYDQGPNAEAIPIVLPDRQVKKLQEICAELEEAVTELDGPKLHLKIPKYPRAVAIVHSKWEKEP